MTPQPTAESSDVRVEHVLVPLDGSEFALAAMPTARALAERYAAELHTVSVVGKEDDPDRLGALGSAALGVAVGDAHVGVIQGGDVVDAIKQRADGLGACVVCLSTHGRGRLSGAVIGSVARELVQRSSGPVVALGPSADRPGWFPSPRWPAPLSVPRIVACVDGSDASEEVLPVASAWARALEMSLTILTVVEDAPAPIRPERQSRYGASGDAATYVKELARHWAEMAPEVSGQVLRDPISPASGIRTYLQQQPAGLVALTSHAREGLQRVLFGAAAASIVHASVSPCLVVPLRR
jgi:nucleotide-binding universal stress UspA family protein